MPKDKQSELIDDFGFPDEDAEKPKKVFNNFLGDSDLGNAQRLVNLHGKDIKYCHVWNKWLIWNGTSWKIDETDGIMRMAKSLPRAIYQEASQIIDDGLRSELISWGKKTESNQKMKAAVELARSEPGIPVIPSDLDSNQWLLNCLNGTLDLKTGQLRPHNRADFITKMAPVNYDPQADCPNWTSFLARIMDNNQNLITFLQRAIGYSLTGSTGEQCLFFLYGTGANGKSTFLDALKNMLGDYAKRTPTDSLMVKQNQGIPNDLARLKGSRFVIAVEAEEGKRLAESLIKEMTGGDEITARFLHQEFFEFKPEFKIFIATNHKPQIRGTDEGIWRRIRMIPFTQFIPENERDKELPDKLLRELPGILRWAVDGCLAWQLVGLGIPDEVKAATEGYKAEMDTVGAFLEDLCIVNPLAKTKVSELYKRYVDWAQENGEYTLSQSRLGKILIERGCIKERGGKGIWYWKGLGLRYEEVYRHFNA